jgi:polyhydroxyalkanoate synthesis regulator phasin
LFVSADDDFPDDHMEIEETPEVDPNVQALSDEVLADHVIQVNIESAVLTDIHIPSANEIRSESANAQPATSLKPAVKKLPAVLTPEMIKQQEVEILAKQQKMEEFHGRVEAIRNTVNNINAKLDQMSPVESKPTSL